MADAVNYEHIWLAAHERFAEAGISPRDRGWLRLARLKGMVENAVLIGVPYLEQKTALEGPLLPTVRDTLSDLLDRDDLQLSVHIDSDLRDLIEEHEEAVVVPRPARPVVPDAPRGVTELRPRVHAADLEASRLNPKYTFDTFVIGPSNRLAHAAAIAVAEAPAKAYNPLFIYGDSGLGKTHLLHAIGHYALSLYPESKVRYVNSEMFTNDFINSIRDDKASAFQNRYRNIDFLLIDDIQFLQGKEQTVEEFFHTFNALHNDAKQVVITSDVPPKLLSGFEQRLVSRFEWGLLTDVQAPDLETRIAILRKRVIADGTDIDDAVLEFIATRIVTNIRELEGALIRVGAFASLTRQKVTLDVAQQVLKDLIPGAEPTQISVQTIIAETAKYFSVTVDELCDSSRSRPLVTARQIAMYLCRELTDLSLPKIGQEFGGRDHTTVMHAERKIRVQIKEKQATYDQITELTQIVRRASARP